MNLSAIENNVIDFFAPRRGDLSQISRELAMSETIVWRCNHLGLTVDERRKVLRIARELIEGGASIAKATSSAWNLAEVIALERDREQDNSPPDAA